MTDIEGLSRDALKACVANAEDGRRRALKVADERSKEICALREALGNLIDAYINDVNQNDRNETAIAHARRNLEQGSRE